MKKLLSILLALILCFGLLISCGNEEFSSSQSESGKSEESYSQSQSEESSSEIVSQKEYKSYVFRDVMDIKYDTWYVNGWVRPIVDPLEKTINGKVYSLTTKNDAFLYDGYLTATHSMTLIVEQAL